MIVTRARALALIGAATVVSGCAGRRAIRIGSKDFIENITVAEVYAAALECAGHRVERHMILGNTAYTTGKLKDAMIDLYPEYTASAVIEILRQAPPRSAESVVLLRNAYARDRLTWLNPAPGNDSQALVVTKTLAERFNVRTLSECAIAAPQLRFAAVGDFLSRSDALPGLQRHYGGFEFKAKQMFGIGTQFNALSDHAADVAAAFTTDAQLSSPRFLLLKDDRHFWPIYNITPVVRLQALLANPDIRGILDATSAILTDSALRALNREVVLNERDPVLVAEQFLTDNAHKLRASDPHMTCQAGFFRR
jgi:osmoprotectant transport system substrate-binding protein